jgi:hypothetical protein
MKMPASFVTPVLGFVDADMAATNCSVSMVGRVVCAIVASLKVRVEALNILVEQGVRATLAYSDQI